MRLQYSCTTPNRRTLKLRSFWLKKCDLHNGLNLHKHIYHILFFFSFFFFLSPYSKIVFLRMPFTPYRGGYLTSGTTALYRQRPCYDYSYISRKTPAHFSCHVHTLPSLEGPNLGQTPQMKFIHIWPVHRGSDSKTLDLTVLLRPAHLLKKKKYEIDVCPVVCHHEDA